MKLACVVQRYGADIAGGSEAHCREVAERLAARHDVTVLTTCARDYVTWQNALPPGVTRERGVIVHRFPVARPRDLKRFADLSDEVFAGPTPEERQEEWFRQNGPDCPGLLEHLGRSGGEYDLVLFWTYRYAPSYFGSPLVSDRAVLVPTAEHDPAIDLTVLRDYFPRAAGYLFMTPEEEALVGQRAGRPLQPSSVVGIGLEPAAPCPDADRVRAEHGIAEPYVLYLGRVDRNKGCETLLDYFIAQADGLPATLVLAGPSALVVPQHPRIRALGYVSHTLRDALLAGARALVVPSPYESLSIVLLEAWNRGVPALVNARCDVLAGQARRANGGLYYRSPAEFGEALRFLLDDTAARDTLGRQGRAYVDREYRWPIVLDRIEALLERARASRR